MDQPQTITVDVISDVACPWCFIGQKRLEQALATLPDVAIDVRWRPYQLDLTIPAEGRDRKAYMLAKFGDPDRLREIHDRIVGTGTAEGIAFDFEAMKVAVNTLDAHRLIRWAASASDGVQQRVVEALFAANFEQGRNISDPQVLTEIATASGMDAAVVAGLLASDADRDAVLAEIEQAQRMGVTGVPCFILEGKYAVMGAQDAAVLADAIRQVSQAKAGETA